MTRSLLSLLGSNRDSRNVLAGFEKRAPEFIFITSDALRFTKLSIILSGSPIQGFLFAGIAQNSRKPEKQCSVRKYFSRGRQAYFRQFHGCCSGLDAMTTTTMYPAFTAVVTI
jgi:hypothetical protein